jgi:hypothetical protein
VVGMLRNRTEQPLRLECSKRSASNQREANGSRPRCPPAGVNPRQPSLRNFSLRLPASDRRRSWLGSTQGLYPVLRVMMLLIH